MPLDQTPTPPPWNLKNQNLTKRITFIGDIDNGFNWQEFGFGVFWDRKWKTQQIPGNDKICQMKNLELSNKITKMNMYLTTDQP